MHLPEKRLLYRRGMQTQRDHDKMKDRIKDIEENKGAFRQL